MSEKKIPYADKQLLARLPHSIAVNEVCKRIYADYDLKYVAPKPTLSEQERKDAFFDMLKDIQPSLSYKKTVTAIGKATKKLTGREEKHVSANTPSVQRLIWYLLNNLCRKEFERLARFDKARLIKYINGEEKWLNVSFSTEWLADTAGVSDNSFRGNREGSYYNSMERLEFGYRQMTCKKNGEPSPFAQEVCMKIDVYRWFFGYGDTSIDIASNVQDNAIAPQNAAIVPFSETLFLQPFCGNSTHIETLICKNKEQNEAVASPSCSALCSATEQVKGEVDCPQAAPAVEICHTGPENSAPRQVSKLAEECLKLVFSAVFNEENLSKYRIRTNKETALTFVSPSSKAVCLSKMELIITKLKEEGMSYPAIGEAIVKHTTRTSESLTNGTREYVYAPEMWLNIDYKTATLFSSITTKEVAKAVKLDIEKPKFVISNEKSLFVETALAWIVDNGFHPLTLRRYVEKHGEESVAYAAKWCQLALESGKYQVKTTIAQYINNKLAHLDPLSIKQNVMNWMADLQKNKAVKPGHILAAWVKFIVENCKNDLVRRAWQQAEAKSFDGTTLEIMVKNIAHHQVLNNDESYMLWKAAAKATGLSFKIEYIMTANQK